MFTSVAGLARRPRPVVELIEELDPGRTSSAWYSLDQVVFNTLDGDDEISFVEFLNMMISKDNLIQRDIKSHLIGFREAFNLFDADGEGAISNVEFFMTWHAFGYSTTMDQVDIMLKEQDQATAESATPHHAISSARPPGRTAPGS